MITWLAGWGKNKGWALLLMDRNVLCGALVSSMARFLNNLCRYIQPRPQVPSHSYSEDKSSGWAGTVAPLIEHFL